MKQSNGWTKLLPLAIGAAAVVMTANAGIRHNGGDAADEDEEELEFDVARLYFELNHTDSDLGIHGFLDGDAWKIIRIEGPWENELLNVSVRGNMRRQGLTELFFESAEPDFDELPPAKFFKRFPEGTYEIEGLTLEGEELESEVELSHVLAGPPAEMTVNGEAAAENCDAVLPVVSAPVTVAWDAVTMSHPTVGTPGVAVVVDLYQLVGEFETDDGREMVFQVDLPPDVTSFEIPEDFSDLAGDELKYELIIKLDNGNQTAVESCVELD